jgi:hypothetical protein
MRSVCSCCIDKERVFGKDLLVLASDVPGDSRFYEGSDHNDYAQPHNTSNAVSRITSLLWTFRGVCSFRVSARISAVTAARACTQRDLYHKHDKNSSKNYGKTRDRGLFRYHEYYFKHRAILRKQLGPI